MQTRRWTALWHLTLARFREFYREPAAIFWVYGFPLLLAVLLGVAFRNRPVERIRIDIVTDGPGQQAAAEAIQQRLLRDERLDLLLTDTPTGRNRMRSAKTDLVITPATNSANPAAPAEYLTEPNRPEAVLARSAVENALLRQQVPGLPEPKLSIINEPGSRYIDFLIPGLLGTNIMGGGLFGVGFLIVDMRVRKLLKRFLATPMRKSDFMLSLMLSRFLFTFIEVAALLCIARLAFGIVIQGNFLALLVMVIVGGLSFSAIGLLLASRAKTLETVSGLMNAIMLPMYLLSGVFFSYERFPEAIQPFIQALPLTAVIDGFRAIINDGGGFEAIVRPVTVLTLWGVGSALLAARLFRWR